MESQQSPTKEQILVLCEVVDHLVDAITDAGASLRRAMILLDIDANPQTTQNALCERLKLEKSVVSRNVEWLCTHGCVLRKAGDVDGRETLLRTTPFTHGQLGLALRSFGNQHEILKNSLEAFIALFHKHMPSLRELKALLVVGAKGQAERSDVTSNLYDGPPTTDQRALKTLLAEGIVKSHE